LTFKERRDEEDVLAATRYADLPYPEHPLVALAHSLVARGVISEAELQERLATIRARLEAE
jgi:Nitrile hydratase beta subunit